MNPSFANNNIYKTDKETLCVYHYSFINELINKGKALM